MPTRRLGEALRRLRGALGPGADAAPDAALLEQFLRAGDQAAFAALVRRHGPMVLAVCRRVLGCAHDAEDAFQATFLVLARRAASVRRRGAVAAWLYGVARRTSLEARRASARRRAREAAAMPRPNDPPAPDGAAEELREALDRELERLPESYRAPLVLCELEGRTRREAARLLSLPEGTVASRAARARALLARRLARFGPAAAGPALAVVLSDAAPAAVPAALVGSTVRAAALAAAGKAAAAGAISARAAALAEDVMRAMLLSKIKSATWAVLLAASVGAGAVGLSHRTAAAGPQEQEPPRAARASAGVARDELEALRLEVEALRRELRVTRERVRALEERAGTQVGRTLEGGRGPRAAARWISPWPRRRPGGRRPAGRPTALWSRRRSPRRPRACRAERRPVRCPCRLRRGR
jgi:RNA polymerase sigma factor (sigma-70 family)